MPDEPQQPASGDGNGPHAPGGGPRRGDLVSELAALRRRARRDRHGYWFPLMLFGALTCVAAPLYVAASAPPRTTATFTGAPGTLMGLNMLSGPFLSAGGFYLAWYWLAALVGGFLLTLLWYRRHARARGVETPTRWFVITGVALAVLAFAGPPLALATGWWFPAVPLFLAMRGTFVFVVIAAGLWALTWAERSRGLAAVTLVFTGTALLVSLYNVENVLYYLGWVPGGSPIAWILAPLPRVLLPGAVLLAGGLGAFLSQRRTRRA